jgi:creatinine amidohydrolase/Fe(II)-dependent formamide hydrolase-like protein
MRSLAITTDRWDVYPGRPNVVGLLGDPAKSSAEHGEAYLDRIADLVVALLNG